MDIQFIGCAPRNFRVGRANHEIECIIIHLVDGSQASCDSTFLNNSLEAPVSAHYCIGKSGAIHQYVQESDTAFHAGKLVRATWEGLKPGVNPNFYTIGIEHEGRPNDEWTAAMYAASAALLRAISSRYPKLATLSPQNVGMHRQIRADKSCPGFKFDLQRLLREAGAPAPPPNRAPRSVLLRTSVNLRLGRPSTSAPIVQVLAKSDSRPINVVGHVPGEMVSGNPIWYRTIDDNFFWAGATDVPNPS